MSGRLQIWHVGNWCIHLGQKYVESPFEAPVKDVEVVNYAQPFVDAPRGAYAALGCGAAAPVGFLLLERMRGKLPLWLGFVTEVNVVGLLSFALAAAGMIAGSLATRRVASAAHLSSRGSL